MGISGIAYIAAALLAILLLWMLLDFFGAKKQEFYASEKHMLDLLRREIRCMEEAIGRHAELLAQARTGNPMVECLAVKAVYTQAAQDLAQISYDRGVFTDKGLIRPGQACFDIYLAVSRQETPLGFCPVDDNALCDQSLPLLAVDNKEYEKLCAMRDKFGRSRQKLFKRLEIYK